MQAAGAFSSLCPLGRLAGLLTLGTPEHVQGAVNKSVISGSDVQPAVYLGPGPDSRVASAPQFPL